MGRCDPVISASGSCENYPQEAGPMSTQLLVVAEPWDAHSVQSSDRMDRGTNNPGVLVLTAQLQRSAGSITKRTLGSIPLFPDGERQEAEN